MDIFIKERLEGADMVYEHMCNTAHSPDALLKHYKDDLHVHDREFLNNYHIPGQEYIWLMREDGTNLAPIGINPKLCAFLKTDIELDRGGKYYHVTESGISEVSKEKAYDLLNQTTYTALPRHADSMRVGVIKRNDTALFDYSITPTPYENGFVDINTVTLNKEATHADKYVLLQMIAHGGISGVSASLFSKINVFNLDNESISKTLGLDNAEAEGSGQSPKPKM